jgi:polysaccharide pyruvyl transferase WcaK-like protein
MDCTDVWVPVCNYITNDLNGSVVFIPHVQSGLVADDPLIPARVWQGVKNKDRVHIITGDYHPAVLRSVLAKCDVVVSTRFHAAVAAIAENVPTVAIPYSHKFYDVMKKVGLEEYILQGMSSVEIIAKIEEAWENNEQLRAMLRVNTIRVKRDAAFNVELLRKTIQSV